MQVHVPLEYERMLATHVAPGFIMSHDLAITDFTEGSDLPSPSSVSKELKAAIKKYAKQHGIRGRILRSAIYSEVARFDSESTESLVDGLVVYLGGTSDIVVVGTIKPMKIIR